MSVEVIFAVGAPFVLGAIMAGVRRVSVKRNSSDVQRLELGEGLGSRSSLQSTNSLGVCECGQRNRDLSA